jgi:superfamily II DNA or RNA helicase
MTNQPSHHLAAVQSLDSIRVASSSFGPKDSIELDTWETDEHFCVIFHDGKAITPFVFSLMKHLPSHRFDKVRQTHVAHIDDFRRFVSLCDEAHSACHDITDAWTRRGATERLLLAIQKRKERRDLLLSLQQAEDCPDTLIWTLQPGMEPYGFQRANMKFLELAERAMLCDQMGLGKGIELSQPTMTPAGLVPFGDLRVGDSVIGSDGSPTEILGVYPQGERECFEVEFSDGASVVCDDEHLWQVCSPAQRAKGEHSVLPLNVIRRGGHGPIAVPSLSADSGFVTIKSIKYVGRHKTACIKVAAEDGLFALDGFVLTHNTASAICAIERLRAFGLVRRTLIVSTASTKFNWAREIRRWVGAETVVVDSDPKIQLPCPIEEGWVYTGTSKKCKACQFKPNCATAAKKMTREDARRQLYATPVPYTIANYELVERDSKIIKSHLAPLDCIVLDEAHRIRNSKTKTSKALCFLAENIRYRFALTGTPIHNRVSDIWSIMRFVDPTMFGGWGAFSAQYALIDQFGNEIPRNLDRLHERLKPVMIRHKKEDVAKQLPAKRYVRHDVVMSSAQRKYYDDAKDRLLSIGTDDAIEKINQAELVAQITYLREVCDSTELIDQTVKLSAKADVLNDLLENELMTDPDAKVVIYSGFKRMIHILRAKFSKWDSLEITGDVKGMVSITRDERDKYEITEFTERSDGRFDVDARLLAQEQFKRDPRKKLMFLTDAGGEGINLQSAATVVLFDMPFNPQRIAQIEDRVHRIGQTKDCTIVSLVTSNTIEDRVMEILDQKRDLFDQIVDGGSIRNLIVNQWRNLI